MGAQVLHPFRNVPVHVFGMILGHLDSIRSLGVAILSHRIFFDAFRDHRTTVITSILGNQVPANLAPFAIALHESRIIDNTDHDAVRRLLTKLSDVLASSASTSISQADLSPAEAATMSRTYEAIEVICEDYAEVSLPLFNDMLGLQHPKIISEQEKFRMGRALYRYELMCNLFFVAGRRGHSLPKKERESYFFNIFSPWVNEQLSCMQNHLLNRVCEAFHDVALHDVDWSMMHMYWKLELKHQDLVQTILCGDLIFLSKFCRARSFDDRLHLFSTYGHRSPKEGELPWHQFYLICPDVDVLELENHDAPMRSYEDTKLALLARLQDGIADSIGSDSYYMWLMTHQLDRIYESMFADGQDECLWERGYVIWSYPTLQRGDFEHKCKRAGMRRPQPQNEPWEPYTAIDVDRSVEQRQNISNCGGHGYWPMKTIDFGQVTGLSDRDKAELLEKWKIREEQGWLSD